MNSYHFLQWKVEFIHDECCFEDVEEVVFVECANCIDVLKDQRDGSISDCKCFERKIVRSVCRHCGSIRKKIDELLKRVDELLANIRYCSERFLVCTNEIDELKKTTILLQHYNRTLLEKLR